MSGCVRYLASSVTAFVQPRWHAVAGLATSQCPDREIRLIVRRARNEFRDLKDTRKIGSLVCFRSRSPLANPDERDVADFSIVTLAGFAFYFPRICLVT